MQLSKTEVKIIRAHLTLKGVEVETLMARFDVTKSAVDQAISGYCPSNRIQSYIAKVIGYWPYPWEQGKRRIRAD